MLSIWNKLLLNLSQDYLKMHHGGKKYGTIGSVSKRIDYDIKHGVTKGQVISFLQLIRTESSFSEVRTHDGSMERLDEMQAYFGESPENSQNHDK